MNEYDVTDAIKPKSDQLNAEDLLGTTITAIIQAVEVGQGDQPISVWLVGYDRPWKPCKSMARVLAYAWGRDSRQWINKGVTLFCDPEVKWAGVKVGGIRVSHLTDIKSALDMSLAMSKGKRKSLRVEKLVIESPIAPAYPNEQFNEKLPAMLGAIESGKMTVEQVIAHCEKTGTLTSEQINQLTPTPTPTSTEEQF